MKTLLSLSFVAGFLLLSTPHAHAENTESTTGWPSWIGGVNFTQVTPTVQKAHKSSTTETKSVYKTSGNNIRLQTLDRSRAVQDRSTTSVSKEVSGRASNGRTIYLCRDGKSWCFR